MWSWLLTIIGVTGLWFAPRYWWGWAINLAGQALWLVYAITDPDRYGFLLATFAYGFVFARNLRKAWAGRQRRFEVMAFTSNPWDPSGYRYTAEGYVEEGHPGSRPGYEFKHKGHQFVVVQTLSCPMGDGRLRWEAVDQSSYLARNTL